MKTVAIVGTSGTTRHLAPYQNKEVAIWMFNSQALADWAKRVDVIIEMHRPETFMMVQTEYTEWLKNNTSAPVYMQEAYEGVTAGVKYPINEIVEKYLPGFIRDTRGVNSYFTSSVCYAIALAIYQGYERIELYGIEMANNTEYIYQRDGIGLWFGIALGHGVEVHIPRDCTMFDAPRYGYDDKPAVLDREEFEKVATEIQPLVEEAHGALKKSEGLVDGILGELNVMKDKGASPTDMDEIGDRYSQAMNHYTQCIADYASLAGQYRLARQFQMKVEKQMEAAGNAQTVIALNKEWKPI
jgi:hypothetical protein